MMTGMGSEDRVRVPGAVYGYPVRTGTEYGVRVTDTEYGYQVRGAGTGCGYGCTDTEGNIKISIFLEKQP